MILLNFNDNSYEALNFCLCSTDESYITDCYSEYIKPLEALIREAIEQGKNYIDVSDLNIVYNGRLWDDHILEIQWG